LSKLEEEVKLNGAYFPVGIVVSVIVGVAVSVSVISVIVGIFSENGCVAGVGIIGRVPKLPDNSKYNVLFYLYILFTVCG